MGAGCKPKGWSVGAARLIAPDAAEAAPSSSPQSGKPVFTEEFNGTALDMTAWALLDREDGEGNADYYTPSAASLDGGFLKIFTKVDRSFKNTEFSSATAQWRSFNFLYGTIEVRAKFAGGKGSWPAVWLLGHDCQASNLQTPSNVGTCKWPAPGSDEIDIAEILDSKPKLVNQQLHSNNHDDGCHAPTTDSSAEFHTYTLVWQPGSLIWKIDGLTTCKLAADYVPNTPMFLILNNAVGEKGAGKIQNSTFPQTMYVDYVHVWQ